MINTLDNDCLVYNYAEGRVVPAVLEIANSYIRRRRLVCKEIVLSAGGDWSGRKTCTILSAHCNFFSGGLISGDNLNKKYSTLTKLQENISFI